MQKIFKKIAQFVALYTLVMGVYRFFYSDKNTSKDESGAMGDDIESAKDGIVENFSDLKNETSVLANKLLKRGTQELRNLQKVLN